MIAVIFEVEPAPGERQTYLDEAVDLKPVLETIDGFISVERFQSLASEARMLSLSFWRDEASIARWRNMPRHRAAQHMGRESVFAEYRLRIAAVIRDYGLRSREDAPPDSKAEHHS